MVVKARGISITPLHQAVRPNVMPDRQSLRYCITPGCYVLATYTVEYKYSGYSVVEHLCDKHTEKVRMEHA